jgi:methyl-accepting chemotaxis protein
MMGLRLSVRVFGLVGTTLALAAALLAYYVTQVRHVTLAYTTAQANTIAQAEKARSMQTALEKQSGAWREIARFRGRNRQEFAIYTKEFTREGEHVSDLSNELFDSASDTKLKTKIERFRIAHLEFAKSLPRRPVFRVRVRGRKTHGFELMQDNPGRSLAILAAEIASDLGNQAKDLALRQQEALARKETVIVVSSVPMAFVILIATFSIVWNSSHRFREVADIVSRFADGDLTPRIGGQAARALGPSGEHLNAFIESIGKCLRDISAGAGRIESATDGISSFVAKQSAGAKSQQAQASKATRALQGTSSNIVQFSEDSARAAESARSLSEAARQGKRTVDGLLNGMSAVVASTDETARKLQLFASEPDRISSITKTVAEIADQANLIAVNMEVEATRGNNRQSEAKLLADDIRKIEVRASKAANEIAEVVKRVQEEANGAVAAATTGAKQLHEGLAAITHDGASLQEIFQSAEQVFDGVMRIPALIAGQSSAIEELKSRMEEMERVAVESFECAGESTFACHEVSQAVADVQAIVSRFKLREDARISTVRIGRASSRPHGQAQPSLPETVVSTEPANNETQPGSEADVVLARRSAAASLA